MFGGYNNIGPLLRNNKNLLRGKRLFKKEDSYSDKKKELMNLYGGELAFKELSKEELKQVKQEIREKIRRNTIRNRVFSFIVVILFLAASTFLVLKFNQSQNEIKSIQRVKVEKEYKKKFLPKFNFCIQDGDNWLEKEHYKNAIHQYKQALSYFPENKLAKAKLRNAYKKRCENTNTDCDKIK